jgi:hypothetical protein
MASRQIHFNLAELSLGRRGDGTSELVLDKLTLLSSPHLRNAPRAMDKKKGKVSENPHKKKQFISGPKQ